MINKRYPLDLTGKSSTNLVVGETHTLDIDTDDRLVIPRYTAYFDESLIVKQNGQPLVLNKDYAYTLFWQEATHHLGLGVSLAVEIINQDLFGEIELSYQVVGGEYQNDREAVLQTLSRFTNTSKKKVYWDDIVNIPEAFIPTRHLHKVDDIYGLGDVCEILKEILAEIGKTNANNLRNVYDRILKLKQYVDSQLYKLDGVDERITAGFKKVEDQLNGFITPEQLGNALTDSIAQAKNEIATSLQDVERQLNTAKDLLDNNLNDLERRVAANETKIAEVEEWQRDHQTEQNNKFREIEERLDSLNNKVDVAVTAVTNTVTEKINEVKSNLDTTVASLRSDLNDNIQSIRNTLSNELTRLNTRLEQYVNGKEETLRNFINGEIGKVNQAIQTEANNRAAEDIAIRELINQKELDCNNRLDTLNNELTGKGEQLNDAVERITALEEKADKPTEKPPMEIDPELLDRLVNLSMDRRIVELRRDTGEEPRIEDTYVIPAFEGDVSATYPDGRQIRTYSLKDTNNQSVTETTRTVFAPAKVYEFTNSINWAVPDFYEGVLARVVLSSPVAIYPQGNDLVKIIPSVLKETFVVLRKNTTVAITINENETSFGRILSYTKNNPDTEGLLQGSFPIVVPAHDSYDSTNKLGRILLYV